MPVGSNPGGHFPWRHNCCLARSGRLAGTMILRRMPLLAPIGITLIMGMFALILSIGAKSDLFCLGATNAAVKTHP